MLYQKSNWEESTLGTGQHHRLLCESLWKLSSSIGYHVQYPFHNGGCVRLLFDLAVECEEVSALYDQVTTVRRESRPGRSSNMDVTC